MISKKTMITNPIGLHARPAADFVKRAADFESTIRVGRPGEDAANAKSMIMVLSKGLTQGTEVEITAEGPDETEAVEALVGLLDSSEK